MSFGQNSGGSALRPSTSSDQSESRDKQRWGVRKCKHTQTRPDIEHLMFITFSHYPEWHYLTTRSLGLLALCKGTSWRTNGSLMLLTFLSREIPVQFSEAKMLAISISHIWLGVDWDQEHLHAPGKNC